MKDAEGDRKLAESEHKTMERGLGSWGLYVEPSQKRLSIAGKPLSKSSIPPSPFGDEDTGLRKEESVI